MKKTIAILLAMVMSTSFSVTSWAASNIDNADTVDTVMNSPRYVILRQFSAKIEKEGSNKVTCYVSSTVTQSCSREITTTLQKMQNGRWVNVKSWNTNQNGSSRTTITKSYQVASNTKYRTMASIIVKDSTGRVLDRETTYSASV